jgi:X-Pro dipeptidyl-peptidase (S15 family)
MLRRSGLWTALAVVLALVVVPSAQAAVTSVYGGGVNCTPQPLNGDIVACEGATQTWDGTKIDLNVFLPPESSGEGPFPLIGDFHGWGGSKYGLKTVEPAEHLTFEQKDPRIQHWAEEGYAVFSMSDRGWGHSCGKYDTDINEPECENGFNHLMDDRYEVRDAEYLMGILAEEGRVEPKKIGVTGASYGGGMSMALASLRNREMLPNGELVPWENEEGEELEIAAAVPQWPWTDLAYALAPNGRNLDYVTNSTYKGPEGTFPVGVMKYSWDEYLYKAGLALSNYNEEDPEADVPGWILRLEAGEPYTDSSIQGIITELTTFHSSFYIDHSEEPSPLLIQSGWNDDLFPVDEALRFYQRTRAQYANDPISLFFADYGHARSQNKADAVARFNERLEAWFAHYLKGEGASPSSTVETMTTTCPPSEPSEGPFEAKDWSALSPGEIRLQTSGSQTITHGTFAEEKVPTESGAFFDPIVGPEYGKNACSTVSAADNPRAANYRLGAAPAGGYTLMGSPTIIAKVESPSPNSEIAARLLDENPAGEESLVARGLYRPNGGTQEMVFQLHAQGYHFAAGHVAKLELLPSDLPYGRFSNSQTNITVSNLELRLPVMQEPGSLGGLVQTPAPKVVPAGYTLAKEFETSTGGGGTGGGGGGGSTTTTPPATVTKIGRGSISGKLTSSSTKLTVPMSCGGEGACSGQLTVTISQSGKKTTLTKGSYKITAGKKAKVQFSLTKAGRKLVKSAVAKETKSLTAQVLLNDSGQSGSQKSKRAVNLPRAH